MAVSARARSHSPGPLDAVETAGNSGSGLIREHPEGQLG